MSIKRNKIILILGKKGSGKSTLANKLFLSASVDKRVLLFDTLCEYEYREVEFDNFLTAKKGIFKISPILHTDEFELFENVSEFVYKTGEMLYVVDEVDMYYNRNRNVDGLSKILRYGRHTNTDLILISRRPYDIPRLITAMADTIYVFKIQEPRDLAYLKNFDHEIESKIKTLPQYSHIEINT